MGFVLACLFVASLAPTPNTGAATNVGWLGGGTPQLNMVGTTTAEATNRADPGSCTNMTIPVVRSSYQQLLTNNEPHCMVRTSEGLVDSRLTLIQPNDFPKAYPIDLTMAGYPVLVPTPGYPGAFLVTADAAYPGANIGFYRQLSNYLTFNGSVSSPRFNVSAPDLYFRYPNGRGMAFNELATLNFSNSGTYAVVEAMYYGFVRINLTTLQMTAFAPNSIVNSAGNPLGAVTAISPSGKYAALAYTVPGWGNKYFKVIDVDSCGGGTTAAYDAATTACKSVDYLAAAQSAIPGLAEINNVTFANDNSLNFVATIQNGTTRSYARYEMTASGEKARLEQYLAMGDSFASGEGTFNYLAGTDTGLNKCHQSVYAYASLMSARVGSTASVACSGAVMNNIRDNNSEQRQDQLLTSYKPSDADETLAKANHTPGVILQSKFINQDNPQAVTISIGGNDIGFSNIIDRCILSFNSSHTNDCYATYNERQSLVNAVDAQFGNLVSTYKRLRLGDSTRRVYVVGYPQVITAGGNCGLNVRFSKSETKFASDLVSYLNSVIAKAAASAGVRYINTEHALDGHKLCEPGTKAVNGLTAGNDIFHLVGNESYHPNQLGHELLASAILSATKNLTLPMPASPDVPQPHLTDNLAILEAPKTTDPVYMYLNVSEDSVQKLSDLMAVNVNQFRGIVRPNSPFRAVLHSAPTDLGTLMAGADGAISGSVQVPSGLAPGFHTLHLYGKNIVGDPIDIQQTVYLEASADDFDGDGVANSVDSCPAMPQSGQDADQDSIDDICDPVIGNPPVSPPIVQVPSLTPVVPAPLPAPVATTTYPATVPDVASTQSTPGINLQIAASQTLPEASGQIIALAQPTAPNAHVSPDRNAGAVLGATTPSALTDTGASAAAPLNTHLQLPAPKLLPVPHKSRLLLYAWPIVVVIAIASFLLYRAKR